MQLSYWFFARKILLKCDYHWNKPHSYKLDLWEILDFFSPPKNCEFWNYENFYFCERVQPCLSSLSSLSSQPCLLQPCLSSEGIKRAIHSHSMSDWLELWQSHLGLWRILWEFDSVVRMDFWDFIRLNLTHILQLVFNHRSVRIEKKIIKWEWIVKHKKQIYNILVKWLLTASLFIITWLQINTIKCARMTCFNVT